MEDPFADIRPYRDSEVAGVLARLLDDSEFLDTLTRFRFPSLGRIAPALMRPLVRARLNKEVVGVSDVGSMQGVIKHYMDQMIERTTGGFTVSGLDALDVDTPYLFISNHRDIAMDPAFVNYALHRSGFDTVRIAIGDNLLTKPWVSDLMRLNKSFIVKRSVSGPRELLKASKTLSSYIRYSLQQEQAPVWIAQREGRAKDGIDRSEPVIIKMLSMSREKSEEDFGAHMRSLNIVPVAISYELDPCDARKANELYQLAQTGNYQKGEQEDVASIGLGIAGNKGRVHVSFGTPLGADFQTAEEIASEIDRQVISTYCLHPTNIYAYEMLDRHKPSLPGTLSVEPGDCSRERFEQRIHAMPAEHRPFALAIYANAIVSKLEMNNT
ncbi:MAG: 1-acyl-sn-glycerol-3-phosphate acyltransferase [Pseudomonadota bacterium]